MACTVGERMGSCQGRPHRQASKAQESLRRVLFYFYFSFTASPVGFQAPFLRWAEHCGDRIKGLGTRSMACGEDGIGRETVREEKRALGNEWTVSTGPERNACAVI